MGGKGLIAADVKYSNDGTSDEEAQAGKAESEAVWPDSAPTDSDDPNLARIIDAWPMLPQAVKAGIVEMVQAATYNAHLAPAEYICCQEGHVSDLYG